MLYSNPLDNSIHSVANQLVDAFGLAILHAHEHHLGTTIPRSVSLKNFIDKRFDEIPPKELWRLVHLSIFWGGELFEAEYDNDGNLLTISTIHSQIDFHYFFNTIFFIQAYDNLVLKLQLCRRTLLSQPTTKRTHQKFKALFNHHIEVPKQDFVAYGYFCLHFDDSINFMVRELDPNDYELIVRKKPIGYYASRYGRHYVGAGWFKEKREKHLLTLSKYLGKAGIKTMSIQNTEPSNTIENRMDSIEEKQKIIRGYYEVT